MKDITKKILVTGATGMLGSRLVYDLINRGYHVKALYRSKQRIDQFERNVSYYVDNPENYTKKVEWVMSDILDYASLCDVSKGVDEVFHTAAMVSFDPTDRQTMFNVNIKGTANLVNACIENGVKRFCHVSSIAALGKEDEATFIDEESTWIPEKKQSGYSVSKFHSEMEVWRGINEGLEAVIVNPSIILGPGEWTAGSASFFNNIYNGLPFYTKGTTGFVDLLDVTEAMVLLMQDENFERAKRNRFVLNAENLTYKDFFEKTARSLGVKPPRIFAPDIILSISWRAVRLFSIVTGKKPQITRDSVSNANKVSQFDGSKISKEFDFEYTPIEESIKEVAAMFVAMK